MRHVTRQWRNRFQFRRDKSVGQNRGPSARRCIITCQSIAGCDERRSRSIAVARFVDVPDRLGLIHLTGAPFCLIPSNFPPLEMLRHYYSVQPGFLYGWFWFLVCSRQFLEGVECGDVEVAYQRRRDRQAGRFGLLWCNGRRLVETTGN